MKRILLIALLLATPAFAATMRTSAIQAGNTLVPLNAGDPMALTTTFAGTPMQNTYPNALVFQTDLAPIGAGTITFTLSIGGQTLPTITETYNCVVLGGSGCSISGLHHANDLPLDGWNIGGGRKWLIHNLRLHVS